MNVCEDCKHSNFIGLPSCFHPKAMRDPQNLIRRVGRSCNHMRLYGQDTDTHCTKEGVWFEAKEVEKEGDYNPPKRPARPPTLLIRGGVIINEKDALQSKGKVYEWISRNSSVLAFSSLNLFFAVTSVVTVFTALLTGDVAYHYQTFVLSSAAILSAVISIYYWRCHV